VKNNAMMKCTLIVLGLMLFVSACGSSKNEADGEAFEIVMDGEGSGDEGIYEDDSLMDFEDWGPYEDYDGFDPPYNASRRKYMDLVHTKIEASFNWEESQMIGKATLTMKPHFYATDSVVLDAKGMEITAVWMNGNELQYEYPDGEKLTVHFGQNFKKDERLR
jgi:hypothetical protein